MAAEGMWRRQSWYRVIGKAHTGSTAPLRPPEGHRRRWRRGQETLAGPGGLKR